MNTRFLETFVWLYKLQSFNRTAEKLNTSQPAISGRIAAFEDYLGVQLYERHAKGFELTPAGRRIIERCESIVGLTNDLRRLVHDDNFLDRPLRIGSADIVTLTWLPQFVESAKAQYPDIEFEFVTDSGSNLSQGLLSDRIDVAFVVEGISDHRIHNAPLCYYQVDWLAAPSRVPAETSLTVRDLCQLPIITPPHDTSGYKWLVEYFKRHNPDYDPDHPGQSRVSCGYSPSTAVEMVMLNYGVAAIPTLLARPRLNAGQVAVLEVEEAFPSWSVVAAYKAPHTVSCIPDLVQLAQAEITAFCKNRSENDIWP